MQEMVSKHFAEQIRADQYSEDGTTWKDIPNAINVLGSRYALAIKALRQAKMELPLKQTRVAIGSSRGRSGEEYISGRVDKACLEITADNGGKRTETSVPVIGINLVAELVRPYAVYVRNKP
jgi:hypothetical protein